MPADIVFYFDGYEAGRVKMDYQDGKAEKIYYKEKDITTEDFETCSDQKTLFDNNDLEIIVITDGVLIFNKN